MKLDSNNHSVFLMYYHLVLVVKYRKQVFDTEDIFRLSEKSYGKKCSGQEVSTCLQQAVLQLMPSKNRLKTKVKSEVNGYDQTKQSVQISIVAKQRTGSVIS